MANSYKVPQDVEAEDKLIGPFSFRQFIYLGIVAMALAGCWGLFMLLKPLVILPLPIVIFFGALALPLRKDQPMETYLAAMWQFYVKPRNRMWVADGVVSRITIDIPIVIERQLTKTISSSQAISQFDYLSQIADTGGWSTRGVTHAPMAVVDTPEVDIFDEASSVAQSIDTRLHREDDQRREELLARVHSGSIVEEAPVQTQFTPPVTTMPDYAGHHDKIEGYTYEEPAPVFNPTPKYMQQHILQPLDPNHISAPQPPAPLYPSESTVTPVQPTIDAYSDVVDPSYTPAPYDSPYVPEERENAPTPSASIATPAIMELAKDVSVETMARQLHHEEVERNGDEVVINLH